MGSSTISSGVKMWKSQFSSKKVKKMVRITNFNGFYYKKRQKMIVDNLLNKSKKAH